MLLLLLTFFFNVLSDLLQWTWTMAYRWKWHLEFWQLWTVSWTNWLGPQWLKVTSLAASANTILMSSSMAMMFWLYCWYTVRTLCCRHVVVIMSWSAWVIQLVWWPFLGSESEHVVPTTFLEPAVKWVSIQLRTIHMLPKRCSDMQKSLVCGNHLLWISFNIPLEWVKSWVDSNWFLCAALWVRPWYFPVYRNCFLTRVQDDSKESSKSSKCTICMLCLIRERIWEHEPLQVSCRSRLNDFGSSGFGKVQRVYKPTYICSRCQGRERIASRLMQHLQRDEGQRLVSVIPDLSRSKSLDNTIWLPFRIFSNSTLAATTEDLTVLCSIAEC